MSHGSHSHEGMNEHTTMATNASTAMNRSMDHSSGDAHLGGHGEAAMHAVRVVNCSNFSVVLVGNRWHLRYLWRLSGTLSLLCKHSKEAFVGSPKPSCRHKFLQRRIMALFSFPESFDELYSDRVKD